MSLSARLAVGTSGFASRTGMAAVCGGLVVAVPVLVVRGVPAAAVCAVAMLVVAGHARFGSPRALRQPAELVFADADLLELVEPATGAVTQCTLHEDTVVWPGFALLHVVPQMDARRPFCITLPRLLRDDARPLRRFLLWHARGGRRTRPAHDRASS